MILHPPINLLCVIPESAPDMAPFLSYLKEMPHVIPTVLKELPVDLSEFHTVITAPAASFHPAPQHLEAFVRSGGGWLGIVSLSESPISEMFGVSPGPVGPVSEVRVLFQKRDHPIGVRLPDAVYMQGRHHPLQPQNETVETLLYADWQFQHSPVLVLRQVDDGQTACTTLQDFKNPALKQILYRLLLQLAGQTAASGRLNVGILGYAPSVGELHGRGAITTPGLHLQAICDLNPQRLDIAEERFPGVQVYPSAEELADDDAVDLVIVATPPNSHAALCLQMMSANKHVVCEKPLALNRKETDRMVEMAEKRKIHLSCHQNRRWDPDYLAIKQAIQDGRIGNLFYMETFVGSFSHPCGYWHSHEEISGGMAYDWGAHYLDWIVGLIPDHPKTVAGFRHKRVWHDVTNADQERIWIQFENGQEAEFLHSAIAAASKPKWYILGTEGAIVGHWKALSAYTVDPVLYFHRHDLPETEVTPELTLYRRHDSGEIVPQMMAVTERQDYVFHRNLADHILMGEPLVAPLKDSVKVVAILETAARSAQKGGTMERFNGF